MRRTNISRFAALLVLASAAPVIAVPVIPGQAPQSMGAPLNQWKDSSALSEAVRLLNRGMRTEAKKKLAEFLKAHPNDPRGPELAGMILLEEKDYLIASVSFERALTLKPNNPSAQAKLGVALMLQNRISEGEVALKKAIALQSNEPLARRYMGWVEEGRGNLKAASVHYLAAIGAKETPSGVLTETHLALGRIYGATERNDEVVRLLSPLLSKSDNSPAALAGKVQLALAYIKLGRVEADPLIHNLEKELKADNPDFQFLMANAKFGSDPAGARGILQSLVKKSSTYDTPASLLIARSYAVEGKTALAVMELEKLADRATIKSLPSILTALIAVQVSSGKAVEAGRAIEAYSNKYPNSVEIMYLHAETKLHMGDPSGAQTLLKQSISKDPTYALSHALLGQIQRSQKEFPQAETSLRKATELDAGLVYSWVNLAGVYVSMQDAQKAEATLRKAVDANPGNMQLLSELANFYDSTGKRKDALALYQKILAQNPGQLSVLNNIALNLADGGDLVDAKKYAEDAYKQNKKHPVVQDTYGWILVLGKDLDRGFPLIEQAIGQMPEDSVVLYHFGAALLLKGRAQDGEQYLKRSLQAGPPENIRTQIQLLLNK